MTPGNTREARRKAAKAAAGLVRVEVWVPAEDAEHFRREAARARDQAAAFDRLMASDADLI